MGVAYTFEVTEHNVLMDKQDEPKDKGEVTTQALLAFLQCHKQTDNGDAVSAWL